MRGNKRQRWRALIVTTFIAGFSLAVLAQVRGQYLTIYGGPTYDSSTGNGYQGGFPYASSKGNIVATGAYAYVAGNFVGARALRWDSSGQMSELGDLGGNSDVGSTSEVVYSVNSAGAAVGNATKYVNGVLMGQRPVRWDASQTTPTELDNLGTTVDGITKSYAYAINETGTVVGTVDKYVGGVFEGSRAVRWDAAGTAATELGNLGTSNGLTSTSAVAINANGTAVGFAYDPHSNRILGVRWDASGTSATQLGSFSVSSRGPDIAIYTPLAINDAGMVIGYAENNSGGTFAVRWDTSGAITALGGLSSTGGGGEYANVINASGTAIGYALKYDGAGTSLGKRAVRWDASGTSATELSNLGVASDGTTQSEAFGINSDGDIVGYADENGDIFDARAVMWNPDGTAIDLTSLIDPSSGWTSLNFAFNITDDGWITGEGTFDPDGPGPLASYGRMFLIQVPEPMSMTLLVIGAITLLSRRRLNSCG